MEGRKGKEKDMKCSYVRHSGGKYSTQNKTYYACHRSGPTKNTSESLPRKAAKSQGSVKLGYSCPSTLELTEEDGKFEAFLFTPHIGHECSLKHLNLSKTERAQIAGKIADGKCLSIILDDIRNNISTEGSLERIELLSRKDMYNIQKEFSLNADAQFHTNDYVSVDLWVNDMGKYNDSSPVLFYKAQNTKDECGIFKENDFVLVIMTSAQAGLLKEFGNNKICIDSTHGTNQHDFLLTTLLVVDEYGEGTRVAFLISNLTDTKTLKHFYTVVKSKVGSLKPDVFMSDDTSEFYNAWVSVMECPANRLLCIWHVDRNWRKQLKKVQGDKQLKATVYKCIRMVMEAVDENEFRVLKDSVLNELLSSENTKLFGEYFRDHYAGRPKQWAYCYRQGLGLSTNMYLEAMHKTLKYVYLEGKRVKRVDKCISALMKLVRDKLFGRLVKKIKGTRNYRLKEVRARHLKGTSISQDNIEEVDANVWHVRSSDTDQLYTVQKLINACSNTNCKLVCRNCKICIHQFSCECRDFYLRSNMCKHIHAICITQKEESNVPSSNEVVDDGVQEAHLLLGEHNHQMHKSNDDNAMFKTKLDVLYAYVSKNTLSGEEAIKMHKFLDGALGLVKAVPVNHGPSNRKVTKQIHFESTKKKRECNPQKSVTKPSEEEKQTLQDVLLSRDDHLYCKKPRLFCENLDA